MSEFDQDLLAQLHAAKTVRIETSRGADAPEHRTIIWVVVDPDGHIFIRSHRGVGARWYREARANPECALWIGRDRVAVLAEHVTDAVRIRTCSDLLLAKYAGDPAARSMVRDEILDTTLELHPPS